MLSTIDLDSLLEKIDSEGWMVIQTPEIIWRPLLDQLIIHKKNNLFKSATITQSTDLKSAQAIRNDSTLWIDPDSVIPAEKNYLQLMTEIMHSLKNYFRISLTHFETHYAHYPPGHYYKIHSDQTLTNNQRHFSFVLYLNENWTECDGGEIIAYSESSLAPQKILFSELPLAGKLVIFKSHLLHEVKIGKNHRYSVTGWMRTG